MNADSVAEATPDGYQVGDLLIDMRVRRVTRNGVELRIGGRSFDLLVVLVRAAPRLLSTEELMECVWPGIVVNPETITQRIKLLRQELGDSAESPVYIAAVRGHGYRLLPAVAALAALPQPAAEADSSRSATTSAPVESAKPLPLSVHGLRFWIAALIVLLAASGGVWLGLRDRAGQPVTDTSSTRPVLSEIPRSSVAVMPFANLTGQPAKDYLGDGMAEELINSLNQVPGLKVPARTSVFAYKGRNVDIRRIAEELGVATILEGSIRSTGERLRVSARLVDATSGFQIWSQDYDRQSADIFKLQDDLAAQIVQALRGYVRVELTVPPERMPPSKDVQAYELYMQARSVSHGTDASERHAALLLDQALVLDPDFANALGLRAITHAGAVALSGAPLPLLEGAERDATRALTLNPRSVEANTAQELIYALRGNWVAAEESFHAAMVAGANDPIMRSLHDMILLRPSGRLQQARAELTETYHLAPDDGFTAHELALTDSLLGLDADAMKFGDLGEQIGGEGPPHSDIELVRARAAARSGRFAEAADFAVRALPESLRSARGRQAMQAFYAALADPAKRPAALEALQNFVPVLKANVVEGRTRMFFVDAFVMLGALDAAYDLANWSVDQRAQTPGSIEWSDVWAPEMRPFRADARFQAFTTRLKLMDYWKQFGPPDNCELKDDTLNCR